MDRMVDVDLRPLAKGIELIEMAYTNGLRLVPEGGETKLRKNPDASGYNEEQAKVIIGMLKQNKQVVLDITADQEQAKKLLAQSQLRMIEANEWLLTHLDLWDRLEKAYRMVFKTTECVMGADGCRDLAVVRCKACVEEIDNGI
jgi:hypothetical protein